MWFAFLSGAALEGQGRAFINPWFGVLTGKTILFLRLILFPCLPPYIYATILLKGIFKQIE